jgi:hypothetical protein
MQVRVEGVVAADDSVAITRSEKCTPFWIDPVVPTRMKVVAPMAASSSTAIAVDGDPIPVEQIETMRPPSSPV